MILVLFDSLDLGALERCGTVLHDTERDPGQLQRLDDKATEARLTRSMLEQMHAHDAPPEAFERLGLAP